MTAILGRIAKGAFSSGMTIARNIDTRVLSKNISWQAEIKPLPIDMSSPVKPEVILPFSVKDSLLSVGTFLADSYVQGHAEKENRAREMVGSLVTEAKEKALDIHSLSPPDKETLSGKFSSLQEQHSESKKHIQSAETTVKFVKDLVKSELKEVLKAKLDPKVIEQFWKAIRTSSSIGGAVLPPLRVLNNLYTAYQAAKILYPEQTEFLENYLSSQLNKQTTAAHQHVQSFTTNTTAMMKSKLSLLKEKGNPEQKEESTAQHSDTPFKPKP